MKRVTVKFQICLFLCKHLVVVADRMLYIYNLEKLLVPAFRNCHTHVITDGSFYLSPQTSFSSNLASFSFHQLLNNNISSSEASDLSAAKQIHLGEGVDWFYVAFQRRPLTAAMNVLNSRVPSCVHFLLLFSKEHETELTEIEIGFQNKTVKTFPYLDALFEIKGFWGNAATPSLEIQPATHYLTHVISSVDAQDSEFFFGKVRHNLHALASYQNPNVIIFKINNYYGHPFNKEVVIDITDVSSFYYFCYFCTTFSDFEDPVNLYLTTGKYMRLPSSLLGSLTADNITTYFRSVGAPRIWSLDEDQFMVTVNLADYQSLENVFLPPSENTLLFRFAIVNLILQATNSTLFPCSRHDFSTWMNIPHFELPDNSTLYSTCRNSIIDGAASFIAYGQFINIFPIMYTEMRSGDFYVYYNFVIGNHDNENIKLLWAYIPVRKFGYNFLTCFSYDDYLDSFRYYIQPFEWKLWVLLATYLPVLAIFTHATLKFRKMNKSDFNAYAFAFSSMLEYAYYVPGYIFQVKTLKTNLGLWLLASVIFTNAYKGIAITGVTKPKDKFSLQSFSDLVDFSAVKLNYDHSNPKVDFTLYSQLNPACLSCWLLESNCTKEKMACHISLDSDTGKYAFVSFAYKFVEDVISEFNRGLGYVLFLQKDNGFGAGMAGDKKKYFHLLTNLTNNNAYGIPNHVEGFAKSYDVAVEEKISQCDSRSVYVDDEYVIDRDLEYLNKHYHHLKFFKGQETMLVDRIIWQFENPRGSLLPAVFQVLVESGIYYKLEWFYIRQRYSGTRLNFTRGNVQVEYEPVKAIDLYSNISTIFLVYLMGNFIAMGLFAREKMSQNRNCWKRDRSKTKVQSLSVLKKKRRKNIFNVRSTHFMRRKNVKKK